MSLWNSYWLIQTDLENFQFNIIWYCRNQVEHQSQSILANQTSPHLTSPHLTSPHLTSPHLTSPHLTSPHLTSPHLTSPHLTLSMCISTVSKLDTIRYEPNFLFRILTRNDMYRISYIEFQHDTIYIKLNFEFRYR